MKKEYDFSKGKRGMLFGKVEKKFSEAKQTKGLAVCIASENSELLIPRKIYNATFIGDELVMIVDETGEEAVYSASNFMSLSLSAEIENTLLQLA
jgi:ssDNA-binding replication factor A large subunit